MSTPRRATRDLRRRVARRATLVQAVWNYDTLQGVGFGWAMLPGLAHWHADVDTRRDRLLKYLGVFNSNPYLSTIALGVALRLEGEVARGAAGAERSLERLLAALRGPLGAIGDDLVWRGWRPLLGLAGALAVLFGGGPWIAIVYVVSYNALTQRLRFSGIDSGFAAGAGVARVLGAGFWARAQSVVGVSGAVVVGAAFGGGFVGSFASAGQLRGVAIFLGSVVLLGLVSGRLWPGRHPLSPPKAFLALLLLLRLLVERFPGGVAP